VAVQILRLKSQRAIDLRQRILGVVAKDQEACARVAADPAIGFGAQIFLYRRVQSQLRPTKIEPLVGLPGRLEARKKLDPGPGCDAITHDFSQVFRSREQGL
jgi:hypothetical protein